LASESQLYAADNTTVQQAAEPNITLRHPSSTDQAPPPYSEVSLPPPPTVASELFALQANVVADPSIHEYTETTALDLNPLVSTVAHLQPQPPLPTTDVLPAVSPQIAVVLDANVAMSSGSLSTRGNRTDMAHSIPMEEVTRHRHESELVSSNPDIDELDPAPA
jgi:hypothetical protein